MPSTDLKASAPRTIAFTVLNSPAHPCRYRRFACPLTGANARLAEKRGSVTPSFRGTCTPYLLPVRLAHQIEASLAASLERLRRDSVDLVQLHNTIEPQVGERAITPAHVLDAGGVADGLAAMRDQGLTRCIGMTALGDAASCRQVLDSGRFDAAQVYYNMLNPSADRPVPGAMPAAWSGQHFGGLIATCRAHDVAVMAIRVLAAGILATDTRHGRESLLMRQTDVAAEEGRTRAVDAAFGTEYGTRAQTAIRFALANDDIAAAIIGLADVGQLDEALAAAESGPLPAAARARLEALYAENFGL